MSVLDALKRPEYTGERRCTACTVVNAGLVVLLAGLTSLFWLPGGLLVLALGAALVALRGYVVPYTPVFAPKLVAMLPVTFGPHEGVRRSDDLTETDRSGEELLGTLVEAGVLVGDADLYLDDDFREDWHAEMRRLREADPEELAASVAREAPLEARGTSSADGVRLDGDGWTRWLTRLRAIADAAAVAALTDRGLDRDLAAAAANPLRLFLDTCPACGGEVIETTQSNCCGGTMGMYDRPDKPVLACDDCGSLVYELGEEPA
jgi:hypothetical protein